MSLKQFPAHGTFSKARDEFYQKQEKPPPPPEPRSVATVFDVEDAWEMLDKRQQHEKMTNFKLGDHEKLDAARIAAAAGIKVGLHDNSPPPRPETSVDRDHFLLTTPLHNARHSPERGRGGFWHHLITPKFHLAVA